MSDRPTLGEDLTPEEVADIIALRDQLATMNDSPTTQAPEKRELGCLQPGAEEWNRLHQELSAANEQLDGQRKLWAVATEQAESEREQRLALQEQLREAREKLDFLKTKGLTVGMPKDEHGERLAYVWETDSEFDDTIHIRKLVDAEIERDKAKAQLETMSKACAEMRGTLQAMVDSCSYCGGTGKLWFQSSDPQGGPHICRECEGLRDLLSESDAGKDYIPKSQLDELRADAGKVRDALSYVLPLAKGYAAQNLAVASNARMIATAEDSLAAFREKHGE